MKKYFIGIGITSLLGGLTTMAQTTTTNAVPMPIVQKSSAASATTNIIKDPAGAPLRTNSPSLKTNAPTPLHLNGNSSAQK